MAPQENDNNTAEQQQKQISDTTEELEDVASVEANSFEGASVESRSTVISAIRLGRRDEKPAKIGEEETAAVGRLKIVVLTVMLVSSIGVALASFFYLRTTEYKRFNIDFEDNAAKVVEAFASSVYTTLSAADAFLATVVSFAKYTNSSWPLVTVPDYAVRASKTAILSKAVVASQYLFVTASGRREWEQYSVANDDWVMTGIEVQRNDATFQGKIITNFTVQGQIYNSDGVVQTGGPYLPLWQQAPVVPVNPPFNFDGMSLPWLQGAIPVMMKNRTAVISSVRNLPDPNITDSASSVNSSIEYIKNYIAADVDPTEPFSEILYPILAEMANSVSIPNGTAGTLEGIYALTFFWRDLLLDTLHVNANGLVVIIGNECDQVFTYELDGQQVNYLGPGDRHDSRFVGMEVSSTFVDLRSQAAIGNRMYTGLALDEDFCPYYIRVYPSQKLKDSYNSASPVIVALAAVVIFAFVFVHFLLYDWLVEFRQERVMQTGKFFFSVILFKWYNPKIAVGLIVLIPLFAKTSLLVSSCRVQCHYIIPISVKCT